jgi:hypothetical protein
MREIFAFVTLRLNHYDIQLDSNEQEFPQKNSPFTLGISRPLPGSDLLVVLSNPS